MAKGEDTGGHPGRQVGRFRFAEVPGSDSMIRDNAGEMFGVSDTDYTTWRTAKKLHYEKNGALSDDRLIGPEGY